MREIDGKAFGRRLQTILDQVDVNQHELARRTGITQQTISEYIVKGMVPKYNRIVKIANALRISVFDLLGYSRREIVNELSLYRSKRSR